LPSARSGYAPPLVLEQFFVPGIAFEVMDLLIRSSYGSIYRGGPPLYPFVLRLAPDLLRLPFFFDPGVKMPEFISRICLVILCYEGLCFLAAATSAEVRFSFVGRAIHLSGLFEIPRFVKRTLRLFSASVIAARFLSVIGRFNQHFVCVQTSPACNSLLFLRLRA